jgi:two-component system LytT family response regulator
MEKITTLIVDDEAPARTIIRTLLQECGKDIEVMDAVDDVPSAVRAIQKHQPDLVFLDIEMPGPSGLQLLDYFNPEDIKFEIVFITGYSEYAIKAFQLSAIDYLLKPIQLSQLKASIEKFRKQRSLQLRDRMEALRSHLDIETAADDQKIALPVSTGLILVYLRQILYLQADGSYTEIYMNDGTKILVSKKLKDFEKLLTAEKKFLRIHRSYLINLRHVKEYNRAEGGVIVLENGEKLTVARDRRDEFLSQMGILKP